MQIQYGVVEDRNDPLKIGRVRVRVHGYHTYDKRLIATPDLPWSTVMMPATVTGIGGFGSSPSIAEGTSVIGVFTDDDKHNFVVLGVNQGISQDVFLESYEDKEGLVNDIQYGFNDPRRLEDDDYEGTVDGEAPSTAPERLNKLKKGLKSYPSLPKDIKIDYSGNNESKTESDDYSEWESDDRGGPLGYGLLPAMDPLNVFTTSEDKAEARSQKPYYPLITNASDINVFDAVDKGKSKFDKGPLHRQLSGDSKKEGNYAIFREKEDWPRSDAVEVKTVADPQYPFNNATYTESGHLFELDDTRDAERVSLQHRTGTYFEWQPDGSSHSRIVKDNYTLICGDDDIYVGGSVNIRVSGDAKIHANKNLEIKAYGDGLIDIGGDLEIRAGGEFKGTSAKLVKISAPIYAPNTGT